MSSPSHHYSKVRDTRVVTKVGPNFRVAKTVMRYTLNGCAVRKGKPHNRPVMWYGHPCMMYMPWRLLISTVHVHECHSKPMSRTVTKRQRCGAYFFKERMSCIGSENSVVRVEAPMMPIDWVVYHGNRCFVNFAAALPGRQCILYFLLLALEYHARVIKQFFSIRMTFISGFSWWLALHRTNWDISLTVVDTESSVS
jgi:hypothetical protein